jgi:hypothetical protein
MAIDMRFLDAPQHDHIPDAVGLERVDQLVELANLDPMDPIDMLFELRLSAKMIGNRPFPAITPIRPSAIDMAKVIVAE